MNQHRTGKVGCEHIIRHCQTSCPAHDFTYQILEKLPGTGYNAMDELDEDMTQIRQQYEDNWINKMRTTYPYVLNENAYCKVTDSCVIEPAV